MSKHIFVVGAALLCALLAACGSSPLSAETAVFEASSFAAERTALTDSFLTAGQGKSLKMTISPLSEGESETTVVWYASGAYETTAPGALALICRAPKDGIHICFTREGDSGKWDRGPVKATEFKTLFESPQYTIDKFMGGIEEEVASLTKSGASVAPFTKTVTTEGTTLESEDESGKGRIRLTPTELSLLITTTDGAPDLSITWEIVPESAPVFPKSSQVRK